MGKKKKKKNTESLLSMLDADIISQYRDIKEDLEDYQYQLMVEAKKNRKKYKKKMKKGKKFDYNTIGQVRSRRKNSVYSGSTINDIIETAEDLRPVVTMAGRCTAVFLLAVLSLKYVKVNASKETLRKIDKLFELGMRM